jgi:hypothetical protein
MTSHVGRLYATAVAVVVLFLAWAAIAAQPWAPAAQDPRVRALAAREQRVRQESIRVQRIVDLRWAAYRGALARRKALAARPTIVQAPAVRVVTLPPLTITRSS